MSGKKKPAGVVAAEVAPRARPSSNMMTCRRHLWRVLEALFQGRNAALRGQLPECSFRWMRFAGMAKGARYRNHRVLHPNPNRVFDNGTI